MYRYFERKIMKNRGKAFKVIKRDLRHCPIAISRRVFFWNSSLFVLFFLFFSHLFFSHLFFLRHKCNIISVE